MPDNNGATDAQSILSGDAEGQGTTTLADEVQNETVIEESRSPKELERMKSELDNLRKRYESSSTEGKRLAKEREDLQKELDAAKAIANKYKTYEPLINTVEKDDNLVDYLAAYFEKRNSGGALSTTTQSQGTARLSDSQIDDFDLREALERPDSESAKMLNTVFAPRLSAVEDKLTKAMDERMKQYIQTYDSGLRKEQSWANQRRDFLLKHPDVTADQLDESLKKLQGKTLSLEDMFIIANREGISNRAASSAVQDLLRQRQIANDQHVSMASRSSTSDTRSEDERIFDSMLEITNSRNILGSAA